MNKTLMRSFFVVSCAVSLSCCGGSDSGSTGKSRRPSLKDHLEALGRRLSNSSKPQDGGNKIMFATEQEGREWLDKTAKNAQAALQMPPKRTLQSLSPISDAQTQEAVAVVHTSSAGVNFHAPASQAHRIPGVSHVPRFPVGSEPYIVHDDGSPCLFANNDCFRAAQHEVGEVIRKKQANDAYTEKEAGQLLSFVAVMLHIVNQARKQKASAQSIAYAQDEIDEFVEALSESNNALLKKFSDAYTTGNTEAHEAKTSPAATGG
jgi:hypothetical protein